MGTLDEAAAKAREGASQLARAELERQRMREAAVQTIGQMANEFATLALREHFPTQPTLDKKRPIGWPVSIEYLDVERRTTVLVFPDGSWAWGQWQRRHGWFTGNEKQGAWAAGGDALWDGFQSNPAQVQDDFKSAVARYIAGSDR